MTVSARSSDRPENPGSFSLCILWCATAMRVLALFLFLVAGQGVFAADYYVSALGVDGNDGLSTSTPWQTLDRVNAASFSAGDRILFRSGDTFYGTLEVDDSGASDNPITFGSYGTGEKPVISGLADVTGWTDEGGGIYSAPIATESLTSLVLVDGVNTPMGRFPNAGFLTYESYNSNVSITDNELDDTVDWAGADLVHRKNRWTFVRSLITDHTDGTLTYTNTSGQNSTPGFGYFICNDLRTLDSYGEWFHDFSGTGKLFMYFGSVDPSTVSVRVATRNNVATFLYDVVGRSYVTLQDLTFEGSIQEAVHALGYISRGLNLYGNTFRFIGYKGVFFEGCINSTIDGNTFQNCTVGINTNQSAGLTISNNSFSDIGMILGATRLSSTYEAMYVFQGTSSWQPQGSVIEHNTIQNVGYQGVKFSGNNVEVRENLIDHVCMLMDDGGGIYTGGNLFTGRLIKDNIVLNSIGNSEGTSSTTSSASGIYLDETCENVIVEGNTAAHCGLNGIKIHKSNSNTLTNNTLYDNANGIGLENWDGVARLFNNVFTGNTVVAKESDQLCIKIDATYEEANHPFGTSDNNIFARPVDDSNTICYKFWNPTVTSLMTLGEWQTFTSQDANSQASPQAVSSVDDLQFEYNATTTEKTVALARPMIDLEGTKYASSITLQPYTSAVLMADADPAAPALTCVLHEHGGLGSYPGWTEVLGVGAHDTLVNDDGASSISVPAGLKVTMYEDTYLRGGKFVVEEENFDEFWVAPTLFDNGAELNDNVSSVLVEDLTNPDAPVAGFMAVVTGQTVQFTNTSINAETYTWRFGDGAESTDVLPTHTYSAAGVYKVQLIAVGAEGVSAADQNVTIAEAGWELQFAVTNAAVESLAIGVRPDATDGLDWDYDDVAPPSGFSDVASASFYAPAAGWDLSRDIRGALDGTIWQLTVNASASAADVTLSWDVAALPAEGLHVWRTTGLNGTPVAGTYYSMSELTQLVVAAGNSATFAIAEDVPALAVAGASPGTAAGVGTASATVAGDVAVAEGGAQVFAVTADGGIPPYSYAWTFDGAGVGGNAAEYTLDPDYDTVAHPATESGAMALECTVSDSRNTVVASAMWQAVNVLDTDRAPTVPTVAVQPVAPTTDSDLQIVMTVPAGDPDGDTVTGYDMSWENLSGAGSASGAALSHALTAKGQTWQATVTPLTDPYGAGSVVGANSAIEVITIENTVPTGIAPVLLAVEVGGELGVQLTAVDSDVADGVDTLTFETDPAGDGSGNPANGQVQGLDAAAGSLTYVPTAGFSGMDAFAFAAGDGDSTSAAVSVDIMVYDGWLLTISADNGQAEEIVQLGVTSGATTAVDAGFDVASAVSATVQLVPASGDVALAREMLGPVGTPEWVLMADAGAVDMVLSWDSGLVPDDGLELCETDSGGAVLPETAIDMATVSQVTVPAGTSAIFAIRIPMVEFRIDLEYGWNLISLPCLPEDCSVGSVLSLANTDEGLGPDDDPDATVHGGTVYGWQSDAGGRYIAVQNMIPLDGYWVFGKTATTVTVRGEELANDLPAFSQGWNLLGVGEETVLQAHINLIRTGWAWNTVERRYEKVVPGATLKPGRSYWFYGLADGVVNGEASE